jgi:hypothetical protein
MPLVLSTTQYRHWEPRKNATGGRIPGIRPSARAGKENVAGVRDNEGTLTTNGSGNKVDGVPPSVVDPTLNAEAMKESFDQLKAVATLILTNSNPAATQPEHTASVPPRCDTDVEPNWG